MKITMKKVIDCILMVSKIILEHITLLATIIASVYIVIRSQIESYSEDALLLWIISLLGMIAVAIVSEKYFKLNKMNKDIENIKMSLNQNMCQLDNTFITRKEQIPLEDRVGNANTIFLSGGSLARLSDEYYACFEEKLENQCNIEVVLVEPFSAGADLLCKNVVYETVDKNIYSQKIEDSLGRFMQLKKKFPELVKIRTTENTPPFGILATNLEKKDAKIHVEIYSYAVPTRERLQFNILKTDKKMYKFFLDQINTLIKQSTLYESV